MAVIPVTTDCLSAEIGGLMTGRAVRKGKKRGVRNTNRNGPSRRCFLLHGPDMDKTQHHRSTTEQYLAVGGGWRLAVGGWRLIVRGGQGLAVGGGWRWAGVGGWGLVVPRAVLNKKDFLRTALMTRKTGNHDKNAVHKSRPPSRCACMRLWPELHTTLSPEQKSCACLTSVTSNVAVTNQTLRRGCCA